MVSRQAKRLADNYVRFLQCLNCDLIEFCIVIQNKK